MAELRFDAVEAHKELENHIKQWMRANKFQNQLALFLENVPATDKWEPLSNAFVKVRKLFNEITSPNGTVHTEFLMTLTMVHSLGAHMDVALRGSYVEENGKKFQSHIKICVGQCNMGTSQIVNADTFEGIEDYFIVMNEARKEAKAMRSIGHIFKNAACDALDYADFKLLHPKVYEGYSWYNVLNYFKTPTEKYAWIQPCLTDMAIIYNHFN